MNINRTIKGRIYSKMKKLGILDIKEGQYVKVLNEGYMPLSIERHEEYDGWHKTDVIYLAHTYVQNGDLMSDPFIKIMVNEELGAASAIYYQQDGLGIYQMIRGEFEDENGNPFLGVNQQAEKDCNNFLLIWLGNIKDQGFDIKGALKHQTLLA